MLAGPRENTQVFVDTEGEKPGRYLMIFPRLFYLLRRFIMKNNFSYKEIYIEEGKRVLEINILPEKYCNFDCVFCPIGRSKHKVDMPTEFEDYDSSISELENMIEKANPDLIFINSKGEALVNNKCEQIIDFIKSKGIKSTFSPGAGT